MDSDISSNVITSDASTDSENDSPVQKTELWRNKVGVIDSDSDSNSESGDDSVVISEDESHSQNVTQLVSFNESAVIVSSDSENEEVKDIDNSKRDQNHVVVKLVDELDNSSIKDEIETFSMTSVSGKKVYAIKTEESVNEKKTALEEKSEVKDETGRSESSQIDLSENSINDEIEKKQPLGGQNSILTNGVNLTINCEENIDTTAMEEVSEAEYQQQSNKVALLMKNLSSLKSSLASVDLNNLQDKGKNLIDREKLMSTLCKEEGDKLERMIISKVLKSEISTAKSAPTWAELQRDAVLVQPNTFGKQALKTVDNQRAITMEGLHHLHSSLEERPGEDVLADTPSLCNVPLMEHQRHALAFMMWRESKKPNGGLLADDMGLGKTLTVIGLCLTTLDETRRLQKSKEWKSKSKAIRPASVLVVCPASVMGQWVKEVKQRVKKNTLDVLEYHGPNRHHDIRLLHRVDIVLTTYATLAREYAGATQMYNLKWRRVVLDEAHQVRNYKTQASEAVCALRAQSRWALTGTPIHNYEMDLYGIMKYLHCEPFDDLVVWKRWMGNKHTGGGQRLQSALQALMLRRTKDDLIKLGGLCKFPERELKTIHVTMDRDEQLVYNQLMIFSRTIFAQFLHQRAEKQGYAENTKEYDKLRRNFIKSSRSVEVKQSQILVLLLRLRQICIHPTLITSMLEKTDIERVVTEDPLDAHGEMLDVLDQLNKLKLGDDNDNPNELNESFEPSGPTGTLIDAVKSVFTKDHPVFDAKRKSSKIRACLNLIKHTIFPTGNKTIIVSQWTSLLKLIAEHLKEDGIKFCTLDGNVKVQDRQELINQLNDPYSTCKIMLLSLTAGGVGLNLIGANHLLILDPHWNPQLEMQAQDRIYRMGQDKKVEIYRLLATDSIEERIIKLQEGKLTMAQAMLTGGKVVSGNKLTLNDLKMLFNM